MRSCARLGTGAALDALCETSSDAYEVDVGRRGQWQDVPRDGSGGKITALGPGELRDAMTADCARETGRPQGRSGERPVKGGPLAYTVLAAVPMADAGRRNCQCDNELPVFPERSGLSDGRWFPEDYLKVPN